MKYALLIYGNEEAWDSAPEAERAAKRLPADVVEVRPIVGDEERPS